MSRAGRSKKAGAARPSEEPTGRVESASEDQAAAEGQPAAGSPRPTIKDVAKAAGVSKGAVSFALNDRPGVGQKTRDRILKVARDLGWTPSPRARALSVSRALAVGLVIARSPDILRGDHFFPAFIAGVERVLSQTGHALVLQVVPDHEVERQSYRRLAEQGRVDGVFVTDLHLDDPRPSLMAELGLPAVLIGPGLGGPGLGETGFPMVGVDDGPGIEAVVEHLVSLGHTRIAHVSGPVEMVHGHSRREAWARALREHGLPEAPCVEADFSAESGAAATRRLLDDDDPPTAIVFANDLMAMAGMSLALARGIDVPGELSVTGYDDTEIAAHLQPSLTTVAIDVIGWGEAAATRLLALIDRPGPAGSASEGSTTRLSTEHEAPLNGEGLAPARLVVRGSTGPVGSRRARPAKQARPARPG